jgi:FkbM family methyltransferase
MFNKLSPLIKDDWTFVDVGANMGEFTDFFKTFKYSKIFSFELCPSTANFLKDKYKNSPNIIIKNCAVYDRDGFVPYYEGKAHTCHNVIGHDMDFQANAEIGQIESRRLDTFFEFFRLGKRTPINLMKIDVEGAELQVLKGLQGISSNIDNILIECHLDKDWPEVRSLLTSMDFVCSNFYDDSSITPDSPRPYQCFCQRMTPEKVC